MDLQSKKLLDFITFGDISILDLIERNDHDFNYNVTLCNVRRRI